MISYYICNALKTAVPYLFLLSIAVSFLTSCVGEKNLVTYTFEQGNKRKIWSFAGDSSKHKLVREEVYSASNKKLSELNFSRGFLEGPSLVFWENGLLKEECKYSKGKKNGIFRQYDSKGRLLLEGELKNGSKEGVWTTWYDDTQKEEERSYINDVLHGKYTYWYIDGALKKEEFYENGKKVKETIYQ